MTDDRGPLFVEYGDAIEGLIVARQASPAGAASFSATFVAPAGFAYDPAGSEGTSAFVSELLTSGAGQLSRIPFARELDRLGGTLSVRDDAESMEVTVWGPESARERLLDLWALAIQSPRFEESDIERVRRRILERQLRETIHPESRAERELFRVAFPRGHPYRETGNGRRATVLRIKRRDLHRFHQEHFTGGGGLVIVTSRRPLVEIRRGIGRRLRTIADRKAPPIPPMPRPGTTDRSVQRIRMSGRSQVEIRMGGPSIARSAPEFPAAFLANEVLGGRPLLSRLFQEVRERHGLAYDASSEFDAMRWGGVWQASAGTGPERVEKVLPMIQAEVDRIRSELVPSEQLDQIRESAIGEGPLQLETTGGAHELAVDVVYHALPGDFYLQWPALLRAVSPAEMRRAAAIAFDAGTTATIIAGPLGKYVTD
jgi:zinc protease